MEIQCGKSQVLKVAQVKCTIKRIYYNVYFSGLQSCPVCLWAKPFNLWAFLIFKMEKGLVLPNRPWVIQDGKKQPPDPDVGDWKFNP